MRIELMGTEPIPGGRQAFVRAWDDAGRPIGFGADGTCEIERVRMFNPPRAVPDPSGAIVRPHGRFRHDPDAALQMEVERVVRLVGKPGDRIVLGKTARTTTVVRPAAGTASPVDGRVARGGADESFATIRAGAGTSAADNDTSINLALQASTTTDQFAVLRRGIFGFDTSAIGTDTISSATLQLFGAAKVTGLGDSGVCIVTASPASASTLATADFAVASFGSTELATRIAITASWSEVAYNDFTLNASGLAAINKTGNTFFGARIGWDLDNSFGGSWSSGAQTGAGILFADTAGTTSDPVLTIEHAAVAAPTLSSPTAAANGATACTGTVSTTESGGTLYWVVSTSSTAPSAAQIKAGQMHTGAAAAAAGSQAVSGTGVQNISDNGLTASTAYYIHYIHEDSDTNNSNIVSSASFTTTAATSGTTSGVRNGANFVISTLRTVVSRYSG